MKMALDDSGALNIVRSYEPGAIRIRDTLYHASLIAWPDRLLTDWSPTHPRELRANHFDALLDAPPEVLILGTGDRQVFPDPAVFRTLIDMGIGYEVMDNGAACRTYNILLGEGRRAAIGVILSHN